MYAPLDNQFQNFYVQKKYLFYKVKVQLGKKFQKLRQKMIWQLFKTGVMTNHRSVAKKNIFFEEGPLIIITGKIINNRNYKKMNLE